MFENCTNATEFVEAVKAVPTEEAITAMTQLIDEEAKYATTTTCANLAVGGVAVVAAYMVGKSNLLVKAAQKVKACIKKGKAKKEKAPEETKEEES